MEIIDLVCKMTIENEGAAGTSTHGEFTYYFCSKACKERFDKKPDSFIGANIPSEKVEPYSGQGF